MKSRTTVWDACLLLVVFVGGLMIGARYMGVFQRTGTSDFGQSEFGAAVAFVCGHGFLDPRGESPALHAFLARQSDRLSCSDLPATLRFIEPNFTQRLYRYLMVAVALTWKWTGISWSALTPLFGLMFALTLGAAYGLFRLAGPPIAAFVALIPLAVSAHHLGMLPSLRDYAKAPFMLLPMLVMAWLAMPLFSRGKALALSCIFGLILGIGFGFRNDLLIHIPPFVVVVALLLPVGLREELRLKAACLGLAALMFVASAWPILRAYGQGSNTGHVMVQGLTTPFDGPLGLTRPPYDVGTHYHDRFSGALIGTRAFLRTGRFAAYLSPEYDREAVSTMLGVARHWPADVFVRAIASTLTVFDFPFTTGRFSAAVPPGIAGAFGTRFYELQADVLRMLIGLGPLLAVGALIAIGSASVRNAVVLFLLVLYYCGYPAIQFHIRHFFHLEFVAWWALLFLAAALVRTVQARLRREPLRLPLQARAAGAGAIVAVMAVVVVPPLWALRAYQQAHVSVLIDELRHQPRRPLTLVRTRDGDNVQIVLDELWGRLEPGDVVLRYLAAEFSADQCGADDVPVLFKYKATYGTTAFTTLFRIPVDPGAPTTQFVPVFRDADSSEFTAMQMPAGYDACLKSVAVVNGIGSLPLPIDLTLTPQADGTPWFQRLVEWENAPLSPTPSVHAFPADAVSVRHPDPTMPALHAEYVAKGLSSSGRGWSGAMVASVPQARILQFSENDLPAGVVLRATGTLRRGGLQIGVLQDNRWFAMRDVDTMGPFTILVRVSQPGHYGVLVTDMSSRAWRLEPGSLLRLVSRYVAGWLLKDDFDLHDIAWTRPRV